MEEQEQTRTWAQGRRIWRRKRRENRKRKYINNPFNVSTCSCCVTSGLHVLVTTSVSWSQEFVIFSFGTLQCLRDVQPEQQWEQSYSWLCGDDLEMWNHLWQSRWLHWLCACQNVKLITLNKVFSYACRIISRQLITWFMFTDQIQITIDQNYLSPDLFWLTTASISPYSTQVVKNHAVIVRVRGISSHYSSKLNWIWGYISPCLAGQV